MSESRVFALGFSVFGHPLDLDDAVRNYRALYLAHGFPTEGQVEFE